MKFTCEREQILTLVNNAHEIISARNTLSVLANVLLIAQDNHLTVRATDMKVNYESTISLEISEPGSITVICDKLLGILRSLPEGEIEFETETGVMNIRPVFKKIDFQLRGIEAEKYPEFQDIGSTDLFEVSQADFIDMVRQTLFAVSDDETRYFMNGVHLEKTEGKLVMVATDGRRLAYTAKVVDADIADFPGVIIPPKVLTVMRKFSAKEGTFSLAVTERGFHVKFQDQHLSSSLIDAQFPNYQRVIPDHQEQKLTVDRAELEAALRRVSLLVEQKSRRIHLDTKQEVLLVRSSEGDIGQAREEVATDYNGPEMTLALNYSYLVEPLREIETDQVTLEFTDPGKAITLRSVPAEDYFHIVMPMQSG